MEISIIIVNYKADKFLVKCLESIKRYAPRMSYEIVVIDNNKNNKGFAASVNKGIKKAKGEYILLLNPDTEIKNGSIDRLLAFAKSHTNIGAVAPRLLNPDGSIQPSVFNFPTISRAIREYWVGEKGLLDKYAPTEKQPVEAVVMAAFMITPQAIKKVGLLDEKYFLYFEDIDYCKRINNAGLVVYYLPSAGVVHIHGASGGTNRLLVESSKKYHGYLKYYIYTFILWSGQKCQKLFGRN